MTYCSHCGRSCSCVSTGLSFTTTDTVFIITAEDAMLERWNAITPKDPWDGFRRILADATRSFIEGVVGRLHSFEAPPYVLLALMPVQRKRSPQSTLVVRRRYRAQARACIKTAKRWKRRRYLHALKRQLARGAT